MTCTLRHPVGLGHSVALDCDSRRWCLSHTTHYKSRVTHTRHTRRHTTGCVSHTQDTLHTGRVTHSTHACHTHYTHVYHTLHTGHVSHTLQIRLTNCTTRITHTRHTHTHTHTHDTLHTGHVPHTLRTRATHTRHTTDTCDRTRVVPVCIKTLCVLPWVCASRQMYPHARTWVCVPTHIWAVDMSAHFKHVLYTYRCQYVCLRTTHVFVGYSQ